MKNILYLLKLCEAFDYPHNPIYKGAELLRAIKNAKGELEIAVKLLRKSNFYGVSTCDLNFKEIPMNENVLFLTETGEISVGRRDGLYHLRINDKLEDLWHNKIIGWYPKV